MKKFIFAAGRMLFIFVSLVVSAAHPAPSDAGVPSVSESDAGLHVSLRKEADAALNRALDWLAACQKPNGAWSNEDFPALTAFPVLAFIQSEYPGKNEIVSKGINYILSCVRDDGGIYRDVKETKGGGLSNYNTAICMTALHAAGYPALTPIVQSARKFVAASQHLGDDVYRGGFGYDRETKRAYTDLLNTFYAVEGMRKTESVEDLRSNTEERVDIDWDATVKFAERMQNKPVSGTNDAGGFIYNPSDPKAGAATNESGAVYFRSYGSMTYAGLLALIYANVSRDDARVRSAFDWAREHWSLQENPGMGAQGLYFFYNVLTKALSAYGRDLVPLKDGSYANWREDIVEKLIELQKVDPKTGYGFWQNETGRYWENDSVLVTAYSVLTLQMAFPSAQPTAPARTFEAKQSL